MSFFESIKQQATSNKQQARPRPLASVIQFNLVAAAFLFTATEAALAQACTGGTCPQVIVTGVRFTGGGGGFGGSGYTTFDASKETFEYFGDLGEEVAAPTIGTPETCAAFQAELDARSCSQHHYQQPNGCGASGGWLTGVLNTAIPQSYLGGAVDFQDACTIHDKCYGQAGYDRYRCDAQFGTELTTACEGGQDAWRSQAIDMGHAGDQLASYVREQLYQCTGQGTIMQGAVGQFGAPAFEAGQKVAACLELKSEAQKLGCAIN